jgi:protein-S-isoprenylcysteine O-methyltransferase Ste14
MNPWKQTRAILLLPFVVTLVIPGGILLLTRSVQPGCSLISPLYIIPILLGVIVIGLGLTLMASTIALFIKMGRGTLAPWDPTQKLVVYGVYRHIRNPMISGVFCILLGEAILLGSLPLFFWFASFLVGNLIYIPLAEEPGLEKRFGAEYLRYKKKVPRWLPRWRPWEGE